MVWWTEVDRRSIRTSAGELLAGGRWWQRYRSTLSSHILKLAECKIDRFSRDYERLSGNLDEGGGVQQAWMIAWIKENQHGESRIGKMRGQCLDACGGRLG